MSVLEINNIKKKFGNNEVLRGISFSLEEGEVLSVIGSSGSGKTTLLRCLNFLERADEGTIAVDGNVIFDASQKGRVSEREIRKMRLNFGLVFQDFNLFPQYSVMDNLLLAPKLLAKEDPEFKHNKKEIFAQIEEKAASLLAKVGLSDKKDAYPCELSGGQKQRVSIARALCLSPRVLFFDEPTSALDPLAEYEMFKRFHELVEGKCAVYISHRLSSTRFTDRIAVLNQGLLAEYGSHQELMSIPEGIYAGMFRVQAEYYM